MKHVLVLGSTALVLLSLKLQSHATEIIEDRRICHIYDDFIVFPKSRQDESFIWSLEAEYRVLNSKEVRSVSETVLTRFIYLKFAVRNSLVDRTRVYAHLKDDLLVNPINKSLNETLKLINLNCLGEQGSIESLIYENYRWSLNAILIVSFEDMTRFKDFLSFYAKKL